MRALAAALLILAGAVLGFAISRHAGDPAARLIGRSEDVATIASASLRAAQEEARISAFAAHFTTTITSEERRLGLSARRTLIVPGTMRYEMDLARMKHSDLQWNPARRILLVTAPPLEIAGPDVQMKDIQIYSSGGILMALTDAEERLDSANRAAIDQTMRKEAMAPTLIGLARTASRGTIARIFALPLAAAGIEAQVFVRFPDETGPAR